MTDERPPTGDFHGAHRMNAPGTEPQRQAYLLLRRVAPPDVAVRIIKSLLTGHGHALDGPQQIREYYDPPQPPETTP